MIKVAARHRVATSALVGLALATPFVAATGNATGASLMPGVPATGYVTAVPGPVATTGPFEVQGTIEATVDGERMTWYSVSGFSGGKPYSSSSWMELSGSERMVALGGFSTDDPPLESFEWDDSEMPASYGTFDGSVFAIAIRLPADGNSFTVTFPGQGGANALSYQPRATLQNVLATTFMVAEGTLSVARAEISGGLGRAEGTFSGTFRTMSGNGSVEITDGVFAVEAIPSLESIRR